MTITAIIITILDKIKIPGSFFKVKPYLILYESDDDALFRFWKPIDYTPFFKNLTLKMPNIIIIANIINAIAEPTPILFGPFAAKE